MFDVCFRGLAVTSFALGLLGCASATEQSSSKPSAQLWDETARQADALTSIQKDFGKTHQLKGVVLQTVVNRLNGEGFTCGLEYKMLPALEKGSIDHFVTQSVPMIYCSKPHVRQLPDDLCTMFWAAFEVNWQDPARPPEVLRREFGISTIKKEIYVCRVGEDGK